MRTREQVAKMLFDAMITKVIEMGLEQVNDRPDWNDADPAAQQGREVFLAMADAVLNMKGSADTHGRLVSA